MTTHNLFDDVASIMDSFLGLSRSEEALQNYTYQLGAVCQLIKHTHSIVARKLEGIERVSSLPEAKALARELESTPLTDSFRANHLCAIFEGFGVALREIVDPKHGAVAPPLSEEQKELWFEFCRSLENREQDVARLYSRQIKEINKLVHGAGIDQDLSELKAEAAGARRILTSQMSDLDALAVKFQGLLKEHTRHG